MGFIRKSKNLHLVIAVLIVLVISFFVYFRGYTNPSQLFWDENYHIASAYKYINHVFFMEPHPPLGKLFIAWGEELFQTNKHINTSSLLATDYIKDLPTGFSFTGVRFFPVLFGALSGPLFFLLLYSLYPNILLSFFFSFLYLFDNAIIVHSRGAMLDSAGIFFSLLTLFYYVLLQKKKHVSTVSYGILGILTGLILSIKLNGIIFGLLFVFLIIKEIKNKLSKQIFQKTITYGLGVILIFCGVYYIHIGNGQRVVEGKYYEASGQLKSVLNANQTGAVFNYPFQLREHLAFILHYEKGVPSLDVCKSDENGSYPLFWPLGNKSINYRWEKSGEGVQYLYFQGNPVIWGIGLLGILFSLTMVMSRFLFRLPIKNKEVYSFILFFTFLYVIYMGLALSLSRVLYLYHYLTPLIFSFILAYLQFIYIFERHMRKNSRNLFIFLFVYFVFVIAVFFFYSPLTYYVPLTEKEFQMRNWFGFWQLKSIL